MGALRSQPFIIAFIPGPLELGDQSFDAFHLCKTNQPVQLDLKFYYANSDLILLKNKTIRRDVRYLENSFTFI